MGLVADMPRIRIPAFLPVLPHKRYIAYDGLAMSRREGPVRNIFGIAVVIAMFRGIVSGADTAPRGGNPVVLLETSKGNIKEELSPEKAAVSVKNFLAYVKEGHYDGLIFHRVIRAFMIQGGGFTKDLRERQTAQPPIKNQAANGVQHPR